MKKIKILLTLIVVATITVAIIWGLVKVSNSGEIQAPKNQFTRNIETKINSLKKMPESSFCENFHKEIKYYIEDDYSNKRLGSNQSENDQWKNNLLNQLYAAYTEKFIKQAFYVFNGSEWELIKLKFILSEYQVLQREGYKTGMLKKNSITDEQLNQIRNVFAKYDKVTNFINSCNAFSFSNYDINTKFPISIIEKNINLSDEYLKNNSKNNYVNNCLRLKKNLGEVPQKLFYANVKYLDNKITHWNGKYVNYNSQKEYNDELFSPLTDEINELDRDIYKRIKTIDDEITKLKDKLNIESSAAYYHNY